MHTTITDRKRGCKWGSRAESGDDQHFRQGGREKNNKKHANIKTKRKREKNGSVTRLKKAAREIHEKNLLQKTD